MTSNKLRNKLFPGIVAHITIDDIEVSSTFHKHNFLENTTSSVH